MEIQEKTNVKLYIQDYIDDSFILTFYDILEPETAMLPNSLIQTKELIKRY